MAAPTIRGTPSSTAVNVNPTTTVTKPTGLADGDWWFLSIKLPDAGTTIVTPPSGFTEHPSGAASAASPAHRQYSWSKYYDGVTNVASSETNQSITISVNRQCVVSSIAVQGGGTALDATAGGAEGAAVTTHTLSSIVTTVADCLIVAFYGQESASYTTTPDSDYTQHAEAFNTTSTNGQAVASRTAASAATYNADQPTTDVEGRFVMHLFAVPPASGGETSGTGAVTVPAGTVGGTGSLTITGTGAIAVPSATVEGTGIGGAVGTGAITGQAPTVEGAGTETLTATGAIVGQAPTVDGDGDHAEPADEPTGSGSIVIPPPTVVGSGTLAITGSGAITGPTPTVAGTGAETITGTGAVTGQAPTAAGSGSVVITGTGAIVAPSATIAGSGQLSIVATGAIAVPVVAVVGSGTHVVTVTGTGAIVIPPPTISGVGVAPDPSKRGRGSIRMSTPGAVLSATAHSAALTDGAGRSVLATSAGSASLSTSTATTTLEDD